MIFKRTMIYHLLLSRYAIAVLIINVPLEVVKGWKYLGITLVSGNTLSFSAQPEISAFIQATNYIMPTLSGASKHVLVNLLYSNCVPILTHACDVKGFSAVFPHGKVIAFFVRCLVLKQLRIVF